MGMAAVDSETTESSAKNQENPAERPDFSQVVVDTTVQLKAVAFPSDAKLMHCARERPVRLARNHGVAPRWSYERVGKSALSVHQRYAHA